MYPLDPHGVKKWGDMTLLAPMDAPPMNVNWSVMTASSAVFLFKVTRLLDSS